MATEQSGEDKAARLRVGIIAGSTRPGRQSRTVAEWVCADPIPSLDLRLIDLADSGLPLLSEPAPAAFGQYQQPSTRSWSQLVETFDAFVLVTPEYNHSTSAALKNALDHLYREWRDKPVAFAGYGLDGGTRAVEHLRAIVAELGMAAVGPQVAISLRADYADGRLEPRSFQPEARTRMLDQLARWATALRALRLRTTSSQGPRDRVVPRSTTPRPAKRRPARLNGSSPGSRTASTAALPMSMTGSSRPMSCGAVRTEPPCLDMRRSMPLTAR